MTIKNNLNKISPCIWFDNEAEEAVKFYVATFPDAKQKTTENYIVDTPSNKPIGSPMTITFDIGGTEFMALNGGPYFKVNPSISFHYKCATPEEVDQIWEKLSVGGKVLMPLDKYPFSERFGWIQDKFGVSWQILVAKDVQVSEKITPVFLFTQEVSGKAEEAVTLYTTVFKNSRIDDIRKYQKGQEPEKEGTAMYIDFSLTNQKFGAMDSAKSHEFTFTEGISLIITCQDQTEMDFYYDKLSAFPESEVCGWLKDKYGVSWQLIPANYEKLMNSANEEGKKRMMTALLDMKRLNIAELEAAAR